MDAAPFGRPELHEVVARLLLERGADKDARDDTGRTAIEIARDLDYEALVRLLLKEGAAPPQCESEPLQRSGIIS